MSLSHYFILLTYFDLGLIKRLLIKRKVVYLIPPHRSLSSAPSAELISGKMSVALFKDLDLVRVFLLVAKEVTYQIKPAASEAGGRDEGCTLILVGYLNFKYISQCLRSREKTGM